MLCRESDAFTFVSQTEKLLSRGAAGRAAISPLREEEPPAHRVVKEWGAWGVGLAHPAWLFSQFFFCLFVGLGMFQYESVQSTLSRGPTIMLITPRSGGGFNPEEGWEIPAEGQLFSSS